MDKQDVTDSIFRFRGIRARHLLSRVLRRQLLSMKLLSNIILISINYSIVLLFSYVSYIITKNPQIIHVSPISNILSLHFPRSV